MLRDKLPIILKSIEDCREISKRRQKDVFNEVMLNNSNLLFIEVQRDEEDKVITYLEVIREDGYGDFDISVNSHVLYNDSLNEEEILDFIKECLEDL